MVSLRLRSLSIFSTFFHYMNDNNYNIRVIHFFVFSFRNFDTLQSEHNIHKALSSEFFCSTFAGLQIASGIWKLHQIFATNENENLCTPRNAAKYKHLNSLTKLSNKYIYNCCTISLVKFIALLCTLHCFLSTIYW